MADDRPLSLEPQASLHELQVVRLTREQRTAEGVWPAGSLGAVVLVHDHGRAFEVEFTSPPGVLTLDASLLAAA